MADASPEPLVVFVHIRKTAGKTLRQVLYHQYRRRNARLVRNYFTDAAASLAHARELAKSPGQFRALHGHMLFWPDLPWPENTRFVTILRDPVERTLSHYYWLRARSDRFTKTLDEALSDGSIHDNLQTRVISGAGHDEIGEEALAKAVENLDRFSVVGLTERFDESLALMTKALGWHWQLYRRENVTPGRKPRDEIAPETIERIGELNRLDAELYRHATARFEADLARQDEQFALDADAMRVAVARAAQIGDEAPLDVAVPPDGDGLRPMLVAARAEVLLRDAEIDRLRESRKSERPRDQAKPAARIERSLAGARERLDQLEARLLTLADEPDSRPAARAALERKAAVTRERIAELERRRAG